MRHSQRLLLAFLLYVLTALPAQAGPKEIKVFRVGSSSFSYVLIADTRAIVEASGRYRLICDEKKDQSGYTRLDQFITKPGLYEEWCKEMLPRIKAGGYDYVIIQTIGWLNLKPDQQQKLCAEIIPDLARRIRETGARVILYDKYIPVLYQQADPKAQTWSQRYPEGQRLNYLLHIVAARHAGIEKITFGGEAVTRLWQQERFARLGFLYCDSGHPGPMANYVSAVNLAYLLTGEDPIGSPVRKLPFEGWAATAFRKLGDSKEPKERTLYEANRHRIEGDHLILSDEETKILQEAATESQRQWGSLLQENLKSDAEFGKTLKEVQRLQGEMDKFAAYGLDARTIASLSEQYTDAPEPGGVNPADVEKIRRKGRSIQYADAALRAYCMEFLSRDGAKTVQGEYADYWNENNSKLRDDIYFEACLAEARAEKAGNRDEVKRLAQSCGMIRHILALPGYRILMKHVSDEQSKRILNAYQVTGSTKRGLPAFAAYQNKHHNDPTKLLEAWNIFLDIWSDPNLMDKLKASEFSEKVFLEADTEFARRIAK